MTSESGPAGPTPPGAVPPPAPPPALAPDEAAATALPANEPAPSDAPPPTDTAQQPPAEPAQPPEAGSPIPAADASEDNGDRRGTHRAQSAWIRLRARRAEKKQAKAQKPHKKAPWWELPALVVLAIGIAILVKTFVVQPFYIPSASMEKTLAGSPDMGHDRILVNKVIYDFRDPHPGDIVVFHAPSGWNDEPGTKPPGNPLLRVVRGFGQLIGFIPPDGQVLVKRVIATGGEKVWGVDVNGRSQVHVQEPDGSQHVLNEPYVFNDGTDTQAKFGPVLVPKGRLWVMGDHRNDSSDSRYHCGAGGATSCDPTSSTVPTSDVIGKAFVVAWPPSHWRTLGTPATFKAAALAGAADVPGLTAAGVVLPLFIVRRRRRRR